MEPLLLVGVTHRDRPSGRRLLALLRRERPSCVLVEMSPASYAYRRGPGRQWRREIRSLLRRTAAGSARAAEAREILSVLALPPELEAAIRYVRESRDVPRRKLVLCDLSRHAIPKLEEIDDWAAEVSERLERGIDPAPFPRRPGAGGGPSPAEQAEIEERDRHAANAIRKTLRAYPDARLVHVCGYEHLRPIAALLADLKPRTVRIRPARVRREGGVQSGLSDP